MVERDDPASLKQTTRREHQQPLRAMPPSQPYAWPVRVTHRKIRRLTQFGRMAQPLSQPNHGGAGGEWTERPSWMTTLTLFDRWISRKGRSPSSNALLIF
jgi:hypothetical protein